MLEKIFQAVLRRYFGQFITGLENVELAFWTGRIHIQNASLKHTKINQLLQNYHIPLKVKYSFIGSLDVDVPWKKLSSSPVQVNISQVLIVLQLEEFKQVSKKDDSKIQLLKNYCEHLIKKTIEKKQLVQDKEGYMQKLIMKILHNLNLKIDNVSIRIQSKSKQDAQESISNRQKSFACGFCIKQVQSFTIDQRGEKKYLNIQNAKSLVRKNIELKEISLYWEEKTSFNIYQHSQQSKRQNLINFVTRQDNRLLILDGRALYEKNVEDLDVKFSSQINLLNVESNLEQLKQMIQLFQKFKKINASKALKKKDQVPEMQQIHLKDDFLQLFRKLFERNFQKIEPKDQEMINKINKKLLLRWSKQQVSKMIAKDKANELYKEKNKRGWLSFLKANSESLLEQKDYETIDKQVTLILQSQQLKRKIRIGLSISFNKINFEVKNKLLNHNLTFYMDNLNLTFISGQDSYIAKVKIRDMGIYYIAQLGSVPSNLLKKDNEEDLLSFTYEKQTKTTKALFYMNSITFYHQSKLLIILKDLLQLQQKQQFENNATILKENRIQIEDKNLHELYEIKYQFDILIKNIDFIIEVEKQTQSILILSTGCISLKKKFEEQHVGSIENFKIVYQKNIFGAIKTQPFIQNFCVQIHMSHGFKQLRFNINFLQVTINEQDLESIYIRLIKQSQILGHRRSNNSNKQQSHIELKDSYYQGELIKMDMFKTWKSYDSILLENSLYLCEKRQFGDKKKLTIAVPLKNAQLTKLNKNQFKLQSSTFREIFQVQTAQQLANWLNKIQQRIFQCSEKESLYKIVQENNEQKKSLMFKTLIQINVKNLSILYNRNKAEKILNIQLKEVKTLLEENQCQFIRKVQIGYISVKNCLVPQSFNFNTLISNDQGQIQKQLHPICLTISGKKKTHPNYNGQLNILADIPYLNLNYDSEAIYYLINRMSAKRKYPLLSKDVRDKKVLQFTEEFLNSDIFKQLQAKRQKAAPLDHIQRFTSLEKFSQYFDCRTLLHISANIGNLQAKLLNGKTHFVVAGGNINNISVNVDKGPDCIFLKITAKQLFINNFSNYPNTITDPWTLGQKYALIKPQSQRKFSNMIQAYFSSFPKQNFINSDYLKNFLTLNLYDLDVKYQNQMIMRFVDYLVNDIILFLMEPHSLHKFQMIKRGPYGYEDKIMTEHQVRKVIQDTFLPFYTLIRIYAYNLSATFNSFPHLKGIPMHIGKVSVISNNFINPNKITINSSQIHRFQKFEKFNELNSNNYFSQRVLKNHWAQRLIIVAQQCKASIIQNEFQYKMFFQRTMNGDKGSIYPFVKVQKVFICQAEVNNLSILAPKHVYNLINKCIMHNIAFDDGCDRYFNCNWEHKKKMQITQLYYNIKVNELSMLIPQIDETVIVIQDLGYKFIRYPSQIKEMTVSGRTLHMFNNSQIETIVPLESDEEKVVQFAIQMHPSGDKSMSAFVRSLDIKLDLQLFTKIGAYFVLDPECYPPTTQFKDLPFLNCQIYLLNTYFKLLSVENLLYTLSGDITFTWIRNRMVHPQKLAVSPELLPSNQEHSSFKIDLNNIFLRKYIKQFYQNTKNANYRSLSSPINCTIKIMSISKVSPNAQFYTDKIFNYQITSAILKLSYKDVQDIKNCFFPKKEGEIVAQQNQPNDLGINFINKHQLTIEKLIIQAGVSQLPVPLIDINLQNTRAKIQKYGNNTYFNIELNSVISYWNVQIGRWQPIVEKLSCILNLKLGSSKYILVDSSESILLNFTQQALKIILLLRDDFQKKGQLSIIDKNQSQAVGVSISPYVINNRTGRVITVQSDIVKKMQILPDQKAHLETKRLQLVQNTIKNVSLHIQELIQQYDINLNVSKPTELSVKSQSLNEIVYVIPVSKIILKQIIVSSPYVIWNKTIFPFKFSVGDYSIAINSMEKKAIKLGVKIEKKSLHIQFPHLKNIIQDYQFDYNQTIGGYEHYLKLQNRVFYCVINTIEDNGKTMIVSPVYSIKNLLPIDLFIEFLIERQNEKQIFGERLEVNQQKDVYEIGIRDHVEIRIKIKGFNFSDFQTLTIPTNLDYKMKKIDLIDHRGLKSKINVKVIKDGRNRKVLFYSGAILINQTQNNLYTFWDSDLVPGQRLKNIVQSESKYIFLEGGSGQKYINFGFDEQTPFKSDDYLVNELGNQDISMINVLQLYEFTLNNTIHCLDQSASIYSNRLLLTPKYVIVNDTSKTIEVAQINMQQKFLTLKQKQRKTWVWENRTEQKMISFRLVDPRFQLQNDGWDFSEPISIYQIKQTIIVLRPMSNRNFKQILKIQPFKQNLQTCIVIKELALENQNQILIVNDLNFSKIKIYQDIIDFKNPLWIQYKAFEVNYGSTEQFGWDYPSLSHKVNIQIQFLGPLRSKFFVHLLSLNMDRPTTFIQRVVNQQGQEINIKVQLQSVGHRKKLKFSLSENEPMEQILMESVGNRMGISISQIGISLIVGQKVRTELAFICVKKLEVIMMQKEYTRNFQLKIKYINVDNNSNHNSVYPVLFTPRKYDKAMNKSRPFFVLLFQQNIKNKQQQQINQFRVCMQPVSLKIHDQLLDFGYDAYKNILASLKKNEILDLVKLFLSYEKKYEWQTRKLEKPETQIFFREIQISKLQIELSFSIRPKINQKNVLVSTILSSFGAAISNISESQISFSRYLMNNVKSSDLKNQLINQYTKQLLRGIYKILGSMNIVGNPYVFAKFFAQGVWQIVNQPAQGFIKGPIQGTIGVGKGLVYFGRNLTAGTCNSFQAISESLSGGIAYLTMDEKFIQRRQKIKMQKSHHLVDGIKYGAFALYTGGQVAITGLVRHPSQGYDQSGASGAAKGVLKGVAGLVTKPTSGFFECISKVSQGMKNTALLFQDGPNSKRSRPPRVFLSEAHYFKCYNYYESYAISFLQHSSTKHLNSQVLYICIIENREAKIIDAHVLTNKFFCYVDLVNKKILKEVDISDIMSIELHEQLQILTNSERIAIKEGNIEQLYEAFQIYSSD